MIIDDDKWDVNVLMNRVEHNGGNWRWSLIAGSSIFHAQISGRTAGLFDCSSSRSRRSIHRASKQIMTPLLSLSGEVIVTSLPRACPANRITCSVDSDLLFSVTF